MNALSNNGIIEAAAMDQRGSLRKALAVARGVDEKDIGDEMLAEFKTAVARILTPYASAILLDPEYGLAAAKARSRTAGLLLAYEKSGYDNARPGRLPDLLDHVSVKRLAEDFQADAVKVLLYYTPFEDARINDIKHAFIERIGAECEPYEIPFFLELVGYDAAGGDEHGLEYAKKKPEVVTLSMEEFAKPQYRIDVLKVEIPVNTKFVAGTAVYRGPAAYTRKEALECFRRAAAAAAARPFIYLSAGVGTQQFVESIHMAAEAGTDFSGVLCGHATWQEGMPIYAREGPQALERWLEDQGVKNIRAVNEAAEAAQPWYRKTGMGRPATA